MEAQEKQEENKMGVMPVNRLLITMSVPMMISMLVQALYNIVDSMFVAQLNENALTAVSLAFPIQNLMISVGVGTGVGINALLSRSLGEKEYDRANKTANHGLLLALLSYVVFAVAGLLGSGFFMKVQTADPQIIAYGTDYLRICTIMSFGMFFQITLEKAAAVYRKNNLHYVDPDAGSDHQYYSGPYYDLWPVWISQNGGGRSRPGYSYGADHRRHCGFCGKQKEKPGASSYLPGIPHFQTNHPKYLCSGGAVDSYVFHQFGDDLWYE